MYSGLATTIVLSVFTNFMHKLAGPSSPISISPRARYRRNYNLYRNQIQRDTNVSNWC
jgi:hypothetical protein